MKKEIHILRLLCVAISTFLLLNSVALVRVINAQELRDKVIIITVDHEEFEKKLQSCMEEKGLPCGKLEVLSLEENTTCIVLNEDNNVEFCFIPDLSAEEINLFVEQLGTYIDEYVQY